MRWSDERFPSCPAMHKHNVVATIMENLCMCSEIDHRVKANEV